MNLNIGSVSFSNYNCISCRNIKNRQKNVNVPFKASSYNTARTLGYALLASAMLSLASCNNKNTTVQEVNTEIVRDDESSPLTQTAQEPVNERQSVKIYHYNPTDEPPNAENYSWTETKYPDGHIEKDSLGYKISITADGQRTSVQTETDDRNNTIITTIYPDSTKIIRTNYITDSPDNIMFSVSKYRSDGSLEEHSFYNEFIVKDSTDTPVFKTEQSIYKYNEKNILLMWNSNVTDTVRTENNNAYDQKGRIIYDDIKQERYEYKGDSKIPYRSVSECDSCRRIKLYNSDGTIEKDFFEASDGTITEVTDSIF